MKQKKAGRISQRQREKRRYPFNESTKLIELVDKKHYGDVVKLTERLKPYLTDGEKGGFSLTLGDIRDRTSDSENSRMMIWITMVSLRLYSRFL
jgi:hypothetical protein